MRGVPGFIGNSDPVLGNGSYFGKSTENPSKNNGVVIPSQICSYHQVSQRCPSGTTFWGYRSFLSPGDDAVSTFKVCCRMPRPSVTFG